MRIAFKYSNYQNLLLSAFVISGGVKVFLSYYNFKYNITLLIIFAIFIDILFNLALKLKVKINKNLLLYPLLILCLIFLSLISLYYSPSVTYKYKKFLLMFIPILGFIYPVFMKEIKLKILYKTILYIILPICIWFIFFRYLLWFAPPDFLEGVIKRSKFSSLRNTYLVLGYLMGLLMVLSWKYARFKFLILAFSSLIILALGARGALVFALLCLLILYFNPFLRWLRSITVTKKRLRNILVFFTPFIVFILININQIIAYAGYGLGRFFSLLNLASDESTLIRIRQYIFVFEKGITLQGATIGHGLGSFGLYYVNADKKAYPHNIFLEAWFELGLPGMLILMLLFISPFFLKRSLFLKIIAFYAFLSAMKTASFAYDRNLFILFSILIFWGSRSVDKKSGQSVK